MYFKTLIIIMVIFCVSFARIGVVRDTAKSETYIATNLTEVSQPESIAVFNPIDNSLGYIPADSMPGDGRTVGVGIPPTHIDNGDGTIDLSSAVVFLRDNPNHSGSIRPYTIPETTGVVLTDEGFDLIHADYNSGAPRFIIVSGLSSSNGSNICGVGAACLFDNDAHVALFGPTALGMANKEFRKEAVTEPVRFADGDLQSLVCTETTTPNNRTIIVAAGLIYSSNEETMLAEFNSSVDTLTYHYDSAGIWKRFKTTQYDNTYYCSGNGLVELSNNDYGVSYYWRETIGGNKHVHAMLGRASYNKFSQADSVPPLSRGLRPPITGYLSTHVGKSIIEKGAATGVTQSVLRTFYSGASTPGLEPHNHDSLYYRQDSLKNGSVALYLDSLRINKFPQMSDSLIRIEDSLTAKQDTLDLKLNSSNFDDSVSNYINGTNGYIPKFTGANTIGNSVIRDDGLGTIIVNSNDVRIPYEKHYCWNSLNNSICGLTTDGIVTRGLGDVSVIIDDNDNGKNKFSVRTGDTSLAASTALFDVYEDSTVSHVEFRAPSFNDSITAAELGALNGITGNIQSLLNSKLNLSSFADSIDGRLDGTVGYAAGFIGQHELGDFPLYDNGGSIVTDHNIVTSNSFVGDSTFDNWHTLGSTHSGSPTYYRRWYPLYTLNNTLRTDEDIEVACHADVNYFPNTSVARVKIYRYQGEPSKQFHVEVSPVSGYASNTRLKLDTANATLWVASRSLWEGTIYARRVKSFRTPLRTLFGTSYTETEPDGISITPTHPSVIWDGDNKIIRHQNLNVNDAMVDSNAYVKGLVEVDTLQSDDDLWLRPLNGKFLRIGSGNFGQSGPVVIDQGLSHSMWIGSGNNANNIYCLNPLYFPSNGYVGIGPGDYFGLISTGAVDITLAPGGDIAATFCGSLSSYRPNHAIFNDTVDAEYVGKIGRDSVVSCTLFTSIGTVLDYDWGKVKKVGTLVTLMIPRMSASGSSVSYPIFVKVGSNLLPNTYTDNITQTVPIIYNGNTEIGFYYRDNVTPSSFLLYRSNGSYMTSAAAGDGVGSVTIQYLSDE